ncbi:multicopper oxidase family protein [Nucisporomicrobium flavum]|uniref:multicopper oxidase family protein n=1 Tax=Nucisporomicrobium flavum TaxID=2785915 RepID=UPI0018F73061|nr:multicopper oxidase domain-containing protein [Nucisporomicrobium flavum]
MPELTRRSLLASLGISAVGAALGVPLLAGARGSSSTGALLRSQLRLPDPFQRALPRPPELDPVRSDGATDYFEITQKESVAELLPGVRTAIWGYNGIFPGPTLVSRRGRRAVVNHRNTLPVPVVVHLHGGRTPPEHDGYPTDLLLPVGGAATNGHHVGSHNVTVGERDYHYPMEQRAATLWYHDHRMDFTAPAVWRGLAGFHLIRDDEEDRLPLPRGDREIPLLIADRSFAADGSLRYPSIDSSLTGAPGVNDPYRGGVLGDVMLVNGVAWPRAEVDGARYRLRLLNGCNARRLRLKLDPAPKDGSGLTQIGSDLGLLERPIRHEAIELASAERYDVIVDFGQYDPGTDVTLVNDFGAGRTVDVMRFRVGGSARDDSRVPDTLSQVPILQRADATVTRDLVFRSEEIEGMTGWTINGEPFSPDHIHARPRLGQTERWRLASDFHHPIHVHLAPFQVLSRGTGGPSAWDHGWKDTVDIRPFEHVEILIRFEGYAGKYVFHCHNLEHEDMMMMGNFETLA